MRKYLIALLVLLFAVPVYAINPSGSELTYFNSALSNTAVAVKASPGLVYGYNFVNKGAADAYVQFFDLASGSVTPGTTAPKFSVWIPAGGGFEEKHSVGGISFGTAITVTATTTTTGGTAPGTAIISNVFYK